MQKRRIIAKILISRTKRKYCEKIGLANFEGTGYIYMKTSMRRQWKSGKNSLNKKKS